MLAFEENHRQVVIIGGGFGGLETARRLRKTNVRVTLVDRHNYHLFQPLLYQVATGGLSPANIAWPLRFLLRKNRNCEVVLAEVVDLDIKNQHVQLADGQLSFDELIVATGATHSYFGRDEWAAHAPGLKNLSDALDIRRRIFIAFEAAERESDLAIRQALMTFVIVGGGPTGVELAGTLIEIAHHTLASDFRRIDPKLARVILVEAAEHVLSHYPASLCAKAAAKMRSLGIEILNHTKLTDVTSDHVQVAGPQGTFTIATRTVLWAAGVRANRLSQILAEQCGVETDRAGRVPVSNRLTVGDYHNVFAIGDMALCLDESGKPLPGLAPVAMQQGAYVARAIAKKVNNQASETPFHYRDRGTMATIGRAAAVAKIGKWHFSGLIAWLLWLIVHLMQIVLLQNRVLVLIQWGWNYLTFNRSARIITGEAPLALVDKNSPSPMTHSEQRSTNKVSESRTGTATSKNL